MLILPKSLLLCLFHGNITFDHFGMWSTSALLVISLPIRKLKLKVPRNFLPNICKHTFSSAKAWAKGKKGIRWWQKKNWTKFMNIWPQSVCRWISHQVPPDVWQQEMCWWIFNSAWPAGLTHGHCTRHAYIRTRLLMSSAHAQILNCRFLLAFSR